MPMDDGPATPALVLSTARRVIRQHRQGAGFRRSSGRCQQCDADRCEMLTWAINVLKAHRQAGNRPDRYAERL